MDAGAAMKLFQQALAEESEGRLASARDLALQALQGFGTDRTGMAAAQHLLALVCVGLTDFKQALHHVDEALSLRESTSDHQGLLSLHQQRFEILTRDLGLHEQGVEQGAAVVRAAEMTGSREALTAALYQRAELQHRIGQSVEESIDRALTYCDRAGEEGVRAGFLMLRGRTESGTTAVATLRQALQVARQARSRLCVAQALLALAEALPGEEARPLLIEALDAGELLQDSVVRVAALRALSRIETGRARLDVLVQAARLCSGDQAREFLFEACEHAAGSGLVHRAVGVARDLVIASETKGEQAAAYFVLGRRLAEAGGMSDAAHAFEASARLQPRAEAQGSALAMAGQVHAALGDTDTARQRLREALDVASPLEIPAIRDILENL